MQYLTPVLFVAAASILNTGPAYADLGDQLAKLLAEDGASGDNFGISVAISGATAIVGAEFDDDNGNASGSAYLFDLSDPVNPTQIAKLLADDGEPGDHFGISVAISGATAIVGAPRDDDNGINSGSAYLFDTITGQLIFKLLPDDGAFNDLFGWSVAINDTTAIVGAWRDDDNGNNSGSAYLFDTITGRQIAKLLPSDGAGGDRFGWSVAISDTTAVVGVPLDNDNGGNSGSAYLFDTTTGRQIDKLLPDDGAGGDQFGISVAISGATAIVGANGHDDNGSAAGSAYLFDISDPANPTQLFKLLPDDGAEGDQFGISVAISPDSIGTAIVGTELHDDNGANSGSAYLFDTTTGQQIAKLLPDDGAEFDHFGWSVAISDATAIIGAHLDDDNGADSGSVYLFSAGSIDFDEPQEFPAFGEATVEAIGSFDAAGNDTPDLVVVIPGSIPQGNGNVQVFLNQGNDNKTGDWNGLEAGALIPVGTIPTDITAGFFNDDAFVDLAVSNAGDNQLSILLGDGNGSFIPGPTQDVGQAPSAVASADFDMDENTDLVVANALDNTVWVLFGDGMGGFTKGPMLPTEGSLAFDVDPGDIDNDKDVDIVGINNTVMAKGGPLNGSVFVILNNGDGSFAPAVNYPVGTDPRQLAIADIDGDTFNDVVVVNGADATVSVLLNQGDGTFGPAIEVSVGTTPRSIDAVDLDGDGDPDLVIAADNAAMEPVVQVLANITSGIGEVEFQLPLEFSVNADPNFVANADFNADELPDIVTANTDDGKTGGSVTVLLNDPPPLPEPCPADFDNSGDVGVKDLLVLLGAWGPCPPKGDCPADFDDSGDVGVKDLLTLLANWGPCP